MDKRCYNCQFSEGIEGKNETIGCEKDMKLHSAEDCCENHIFREVQKIRLINAEAIELKATDGINENGVLYVPYRDIKKSIDSTPTIDPESLRPLAKWLPRNSENPDCNVYYCSSCKMDISAAEALYYKYCPECGSKMKLLSLDLNRDAEEIDKKEDKDQDE